MLDVKDGLVEQFGDVGIVESVDDVLALALTDDEAEVAQLAQLVGDGRGLHADSLGELADRARAFLQPSEDLHATGGGEDLHALGDDPRGLRIDTRRPWFAGDSVTHPNT